MRGLLAQGQFLYALAVIILIPVLLVGNTWYLLRAIHRDVNFVLRRESGLVQSALEPFLAEGTRDADALQRRLSALRGSAPEILSASVLVAEPAGTFSVLATTARDPAPDRQSPLNAFVLAQREPHAALVVDAETGKRAWQIVAPVRAGDRLVALTSFKVSTADVDDILRRTTRQSILLLVATVVLSVLLLANHLRFFESARLAQKLRELDRLKDEFISMAAHELRSPLTTIRGYTSMLKETLDTRADAISKQQVGVVTHEVDRLGALVEDLLDVARIQQGRMQFQMQDLDLAGVVRLVTEQFRPQAEQKELTLAYEAPAQPLRVRADRDRLQQVFVNLVSNAVKYTKDGSVTIRHDVRGSKVATMVIDTGLGMTPEDRERLFEKFYRIKSKETQQITGTGLGLWITKQIVEAFGGRIYVDSLKERGTQFTVLLPLLPAPPAARRG